MVERIAVYQKQRRPLAAVHRDDAGARSSYFGVCEIFEHEQLLISSRPLAGEVKHHCTAIPAAFASPTAMPVSFATRASKSAGFMIICSTPRLTSFSLTDGFSSPLAVSWCNRSMTSRGVAFGANAPIQKSKSESG